MDNLNVDNPVPDHPGAEDFTRTFSGRASQTASMVLDMASYLGGPGLEGFTAWMRERYPGAPAENIRKNMNGLVKSLTRTLFD